MTLLRMDYLTRIRDNALAAATEVDVMTRQTGPRASTTRGDALIETLTVINHAVERASGDDIGAITALHRLVPAIMKDAAPAPRTVSDLVSIIKAWSADATAALVSEGKERLELLRDQFIGIYEHAGAALDDARRL